MTIQTAPPGAAPPGAAGTADQAAPLDALLADAALGTFRRFTRAGSSCPPAVTSPRLSNPPGNPKATYQTSKTNPASPADWLKTAQSEQGSWWRDMLAWLGDRCGADKPAPAEPGGGRLRPLAAAPGTYVFDN